MRRFGFSLIEMLLIISILGITSTLSIPLYRSYQLRTDLALAKDQIIQGLERAKLNARSGKEDTVWGFYIPEGILYAGASFAGRDAAKDEIYPMPSTVAVTGLLNVIYDKRGLPDVTGEVRLHSISGEDEDITVTIYISYLAVTASRGDQPTICHRNTDGTSQTMIIPDAEWPAHQAHGDTQGPCGISGGSASSAAGASSSAGALPPLYCNSRFCLSNGVITTQRKVEVTFRNLGSSITFGPGGPVIPVYVCGSEDMGARWSNLFGGGGNCKSVGRGRAVDPDDEEDEDETYVSNTPLTLRVQGHYDPRSGMGFEASYDSNDRSGHILLLLNGENPFSYPGFGNTANLRSFLLRKNKLDPLTDRIQIGPYEILLIAELQILSSTDADFDDDVLLMTVDPA
ncbi:MAG: Uncharacterized protein Greene041619_128 [Candidatus Peregrinibacteria bacterium Greene0416_19]|nr:MAG: Uncharacterized protein Greene041619_128 [Candidatus Peregrinibacteria bacterium Greene0416_19]